MGQRCPALMCHKIQGATNHLTATFNGPSVRKNCCDTQQIKDGSQEATLVPISSHPANISSNSTPAPTQAPYHPHSPLSWNHPFSVASALTDARASPSHDLVPCVCLRGCHGANCSVYSCSPSAPCSVGICSSGSGCLVLLDWGGVGEDGWMWGVEKYPSDLYFSALSFWGHRLEPGPGGCSHLFPGLWCGSGEFRFTAGGWAVFLSMESCFCFPSSPRGQQSKHELIGCAVWPALFSK